MATDSVSPAIEPGVGGPDIADANTAYRRSLLGEILDWMLAPLFLLWPMSVAITYVVAQDIANTPYDRGLRSALAVLSEQIQWPEDSQGLGAPMELAINPLTRIALRSQDSDGVFWKAQVVFYTSEGQIDGPVIGGDAALPTPKLNYELIRPGRVHYMDQTLNGFDVRIAYQWVHNRRNPSDDLVLLVVAESREARVALANAIIKGVIIPQFLVLPIAVLLIWFGLSRGVAPINALQRRLRARRPDDLSAIDEHATPAEITPLVAAMNDLLVRLSGNIEAQRRFVADAAHQLKTPLSGLRLQAELALKSAPNQEIEDSLRKIVAGTASATRLINQLLLMASAEHPERIQLVPLDINRLAREVTEQWVPQALARGIDLGFEGSDTTALLRGQSLLLTQALNNLIDNALRYAPDSSQVTVKVAMTATEVMLSVEDNGPGIAMQERQRVFDRFYRVLGTQTEGSGLGLAIVKEIMQKHNAQVNIEATHSDREPPGARITLTFRRER
jgi:two-component system sensor histidine kinase TctE